LHAPALESGGTASLTAWLSREPTSGPPCGRGVAHRQDACFYPLQDAHGVIDPSIATTERGIWAIKWSFAILAITSAAQLVIAVLSSSVALLADTIHNIGDAGTAIPLWIAFVLARRPPSPRFTYGYGRVEDLAGVVIVGIILFSAIVAGWQAIDRLISPQPIARLGWVAAAALAGFLGNEAVAVFRIRIGREIESASLIADGVGLDAGAGTYT
jgi:divalent metal cation (Fe/Co/Zn/Cd) transporter